MYSKESSVERDWREESERFGVEACLGADCDRGGEEAGEDSHFGVDCQLMPYERVIVVVRML